MNSKVVITKGKRSVDTVKESLKQIISPEDFANKKILIKVNFISTKTWETGATTDPILVEALIQYFQPFNEGIYVVESDATITRADEAAKATGMLELCEVYGIKFLNLAKIPGQIKMKVQNPEVLSEITFPTITLESHIISAAKMKTHSDTKVTLGLKNMFGLLPDTPKSKYHNLGIDEVIVDINSVCKPSLTIIDGFVAMEGPGPVSGQPIEMNLVIAGKDVVSTDTIASKVMGFDPYEIEHIKKAAERGLGEMKNIEVLGEDLNKVKRIFKKA
ncbi:DUF362 domain-containing protein [[Eubacterium] cellulosolvens]